MAKTAKTTALLAAVGLGDAEGRVLICCPEALPCQLAAPNYKSTGQGQGDNEYLLMFF